MVFVAVGACLGASMDRLGLLPIAHLRRRIGQAVKVYVDLANKGLISPKQRDRQIEAVLKKYSL